VSTLDELGQQVKTRRSYLERQAGEALVLARRGQTAEGKRDTLTALLETYDKTCKLLTTIGEAEQDAARAKIEGLVTRALQVVFGENLSFRLKPGVRANQAVIDFILVSDYDGTKIETPVMEARGGGMAAVVGFALRFVIMMLTPDARRLLALDETFAHVSASFEPRVAEFLREIVDKAQVQVLLVTHSSAYGDLADSQYRLELGADGVTVVHKGESE
jgi:DNA repair ATPase RecN